MTIFREGGKRRASKDTQTHNKTRKNEEEESEGMDKSTEMKKPIIYGALFEQTAKNGFACVIACAALSRTHTHTEPSWFISLKNNLCASHSRMRRDILAETVGQCV